MTRNGYSSEEMGWAIVVILGIVLVSGIYGFFHFRHEAEKQWIVATTPAFKTAALLRLWSRIKPEKEKTEGPL